MAPVTIAGGDLFFGGAVLETSGGTKVAVFTYLGSIVAYKDIDGTPSVIGAAQTPATVHGGGSIFWVDAAIDGNDVIHVVSSCSQQQTRDIAYNTISDPDGTPAWGTWEEAADYTEAAPNAPSNSISIDSNNKAHILFVDRVKQTGSTQDNVYYTNNVSGWLTPEQVGLRADKADQYYYPHLSLAAGNDVEALYYFYTAGDVAYRRRNGTWGSESVYAESGIAFGGLIVTTGDTVYRYHVVTVNIEENNVDTGYDVNGTYRRTSPALVDDSDRYLFYIDSSDDVHVISNSGSGWTDESAQQTGTYRYVISEWAYNHENQSGEINYIFANATTVYFDSFSLGAQPITINLDAAAITASGQAITPAPAAATVSLDAAAITATGQSITIGAPLVVNLDAATITTTGQAISVIPSAAEVQLAAGNLTAAGQVITPSPAAAIVSLDAGAITASGQSISIVPSAAIVQLAAGAISALGQVITIDAGALPINISLDAAAIVASGQSISIIPAAVTTNLNSGQLTASGQVISIVPGAAAITLAAGSISATGQSISIVPSAAAVQLTAATITAAGQVISIQIGISIDLSAASISVTGQSITILPGSAAITLNAATITTAGQIISIVPGSSSVNLAAGIITASGQIISIVPGSASVNLAAGIITATGQIISIVPGSAAIQLAAGIITATGQIISIVPGAVATPLAAASISATGQVISIVPGSASVNLDAATITIAGQVITIDAGGLPVNIALDAAAIIASGQTISIIPSAATVVLSYGALTASGQSVSIVPGAASIQLDAASLTAGGQSISIVPGAAGIDLDAAIITAAGQVISIAIAQTIDLDVATIIAAGQLIDIVVAPERVLDGEEGYGSRLLYVDKGGRGAYTTIQAALDVAQSYTPAADSRWLVVVSSGTYQEHLTLYDYVDITGGGYSQAVSLVSPDSSAAISNGAECTISYLCIYGNNSPVINTGAGFTGTMRFINCFSIIDDDEVNLLKVSSGIVQLLSCSFPASGECVYLIGGTIQLYDTILTRDGAQLGYPVEINGAATFEAYRSIFDNIGSGGGPAIHVHTTTPTSLILHHCLYRLASGSESISTDITPALYSAASVANAAIDAAFTGTQDIQVDVNF